LIHDARLDHADAGVTRARGRAEFLDPMRVRLGVVVQQRDPRAIGTRDAAIAGFGEAEVRAVLEHSNFGVVAANTFDRAVRRAVVDEDRLEVAIGLSVQRGEARREILLGVPVHDDHGDVDRVHRGRLR
jgi:hypothetical protein